MPASSHLPAALGSAVAVPDGTTLTTFGAAVPGWVFQVEKTSQDLTCTGDISDISTLVPLDACTQDDQFERRTRYRCKASKLVVDEYHFKLDEMTDYAKAYMCADIDKTTEGLDSKRCERTGDDNKDIQATCFLRGIEKGKYTKKRNDDGEKSNCSTDAAVSGLVALGSADDVGACYKLCRDYNTDSKECKMWQYQTSLKTCEGFTNDEECEEREDDGNEGWVSGENQSWNSDTKFVAGCTGTAAPGGVIRSHPHANNSATGTADCTNSKADDTRMDFYFVFDKCVTTSANTSAAVFCSADNKVIYNNYNAAADCSGDASYSYEIKEACEVSTSPEWSISAEWWGACGKADAPALPATVAAAADTCTQKPGAKMSCYCSKAGLVAKPLTSVFEQESPMTCGDVETHFEDDGATCAEVDADRTATATCKATDDEDCTHINLTKDCCMAAASSAPGRKTSMFALVAVFGSLATAFVSAL